MREFMIRETERPLRTPDERDSLQINDTRIDLDCLEIEWRATGGSRIDEISYMVIGEV